MLPVLYHGFYDEDLEWVGRQFKKGIGSLHSQIPLYSGLFIPAIVVSVASGISLFSAGSMDADHLEALSAAVHSG